jgi:hypothetical protein
LDTGPSRLSIENTLHLRASKMRNPVPDKHNLPLDQHSSKYDEPGRAAKYRVELVNLSRIKMVPPVETEICAGMGGGGFD